MYKTHAKIKRCLSCCPLYTEVVRISEGPGRLHCSSRLYRQSIYCMFILELDDDTRR